MGLKRLWNLPGINQALSVVLGVCLLLGGHSVGATLAVFTYVQGVAGAISAGNFPPFVSESSPGDGSTGVPTNTTVSITFNQAMTTTSVWQDNDPNSGTNTDGFCLSTTSGCTSGRVSGTGAWTVGDTVFSFTPSSSLSGDTLYYALLSTTARDAGGAPISAAHSFSFRTTASAGAPTVTAVSPYDDSTNVGTNTAVGVTFSQTMNQSATEGAFSLSLTSPTTATLYAVGASGSTMFAVGAGGVVLRSVDDGANWTVKSSGVAVDLRGVAVASSTVAWAVGNTGTVIKTVDGGDNWTGQTSNTSNNLLAVSAVDSNTAWAVGAVGTVVRTTDGSTWSTQTSGTSNALNGVAAVNSSNVWAVGDGGVIRKYDGSSWSGQTSPTGNNLAAVTAVSTSVLWAAGASGTVIKTTDGSSWSTQTSGTSNALNGIAAADSSTAWATGASGTIIKTSNGTSWSGQTSGTSNALRSVAKGSTTAAWASGDSGTLLRTSNGGTNWYHRCYVSGSDLSECGSFSWSTTTLTFTPDTSLAGSASYTVGVTVAALNTGGTALSEAFSSNFTTATAPDITQPRVVPPTTPSSGQTSVGVNAVVIITFSEAMVQSTAQSAFTLRPCSSGDNVNNCTTLDAAVTGTFSWGGTANNIMSFAPNALLTGSRWHKVTVTTAAQDLSGNDLNSAYNFYFQTGTGNVPNPNTPTEGPPMTPTQQRERLRAILNGTACASPASVYDPLSARVAESVGYTFAMLAGSVASQSTLAAPDLIVLTLTELADQVRRIMRAADVSLLIDADHGYGNALNVMRTVQELEHAGASAISIEDTVLPQAFGKVGQPDELISTEEMLGKLRAGVAAKKDPSFIIFGRTSALRAEDLESACQRSKAYAATGVDGMFIVGLETLDQAKAIHQACGLPLVIGTAPASIKAADLAQCGARILLLGHQPIAAAVKALRDTYTHLYNGNSPADLRDRIASAQEMDAVTAAPAHKQWMSDYLM